MGWRALVSFFLIAACSAQNGWEPAGPLDSRSPCPGLNTLANHHFLYVISFEVCEDGDPPEQANRLSPAVSPHDGRNISIADFAYAMEQGFGYNSDLRTLAVLAFEALGIDADGTIDLETLNQSPIEHPASLSRADAPDDTLHVNPARVDATLADSPSAYLDVVSQVSSRRRIFVESACPSLTELQEFAILAESALVLLTMSSGPIPLIGAPDQEYFDIKASKEWVRVFLIEERLPIELGWRPLSRKVAMDDLTAFSNIIGSEYSKNEPSCSLLWSEI
jgi:hypothetical protein